jgi:phosphatidylglycerol:prolipoprotein diacylglycerol transferase
MIQELFRIGPLAISPFGVLLVAAFLASYFQLQRGLARLGIGDPDTASALLFAGGVGGVVGAKIYYAILHGDWRLLLERSGLVWYGGFVLGTAAVVWTMARRKLPPWPTLDALAPALALGYGVGRIGCFLVGDDYGVPTRLPWGVSFANGLPPTTAFDLRREFGLDLPASIPDDTLLRVHPTQVYETVIALAIWVVGARLLRRRPAPGRVALVVFALLALERFGVEFLRAKDDRLLGGLTLAQGISLAILVAVAALWRSRADTRPPAPKAAEARR